jgi:hypothetical protein
MRIARGAVVRCMVLVLLGARPAASEPNRTDPRIVETEGGTVRASVLPIGSLTEGSRPRRARGPRESGPGSVYFPSGTPPPG